MNRSQKIALAVGVVWTLITSLRPPVLIPATGLAGATRPAVALSHWNSALIRSYGLDIAYFATELAAIFALTAGLIYFLKTQHARGSKRSR